MASNASLDLWARLSFSRRMRESAELLSHSDGMINSFKTHRPQISIIKNFSIRCFLLTVPSVCGLHAATAAADRVREHVVCDVRHVTYVNKLLLA